MVQVYIKVVKKFAKGAEFTQARDQMKTAIQGATSFAGRQVVQEARDLMNLPKTGIHHRGLPRRSSRAGEAPASQSGRLLRSLTSSPELKEFSHQRISTSLWYGNFLMTQRDRPMLTPALHSVFPKYVRAIQEIIERHF